MQRPLPEMLFKSIDTKLGEERGLFKNLED